jgi:hypothetical protein
MAVKSKMKMKHAFGALGCCLGAALFLSACATGPSLSGTLRNGAYKSAEGKFSVPIPVSPEVGGRVKSDTPQSVTFTDNWGNRITFSSFAFNAQSSMEAALRTDGREKALEEFIRRQYGTLPKMHYHPSARGGVVSLVYLRPVGPRTGVAAFISGHRVYVVETDLLPGVQMLAQGDERAQADDIDFLEGRAVELAQTMEVE